MCPVGSIPIDRKRKVMAVQENRGSKPIWRRFIQIQVEVSHPVAKIFKRLDRLYEFLEQGERKPGQHSAQCEPQSAPDEKPRPPGHGLLPRRGRARNIAVTR